MHLLSSGRFQTCLLQDAIQSPSSQVVVRCTGNGYKTWLRGMLELLMTTPRSGKVPPVLAEEPENVPNFHDRNNLRGPVPVG